MQIAALTFTQEIWKTLIGAFATAIFVAVAGYFAAGQWSAGREADRLKSERELERQREDKERRRERASREFDLRAQLIERATAEAARMYIVCQHIRRAIKEGVDESPQNEAREQAIGSLDEAYLSFSVKSLALESLIGAHYGRTWRLNDGEPPAFVRWHQIRDLLTLYYFNVLGDFSGDVLVSNSIGTGDKLHSGLNTADCIQNSKSPKLEELSDMRKKIRSKYYEALDGLTEGLLHDRITVDVTEKD